MTTDAPSSDPLHTEFQATQKSRMETLLVVLGVLLAGISACWTAVFIYSSHWDLAVLDGAMVVVGLACVGLVRAGRLRWGTWLMLPSLYVNLLILASVFDVPTANAPRSAHLYFLTLAISAYVLLQFERAWVRFGVVFFTLSTFVVFASTNMGFQSPYVMPEAWRAGGTWLNTTLALASVSVLVTLIQSNITLRTKAELELRKALREAHWVLHYQPQVNAQGHVYGAEALLRWQHPQKGLLHPAEFIPLAEKSGHIVALGTWVLNAACRQLMLWGQQPETRHLELSINVSAQQFREQDFVGLVMQALRQCPQHAQRLKLELTESMLVENQDALIEKMRTLHRHGVRVSLDDFGTGFSSLNYLRRLPLDQLKIDKSFVLDVLTQPHDAAIARTIIALGRNLQLKVVAEGVETEGQRKFLFDNGCHMFQGFLFSRPLPLSDFESYLRQRAWHLGSRSHAGAAVMT